MIAFCALRFFFPWGKCEGIRLLRHMVYTCLHILKSLSKINDNALPEAVFGSSSCFASFSGIVRFLFTFCFVHVEVITTSSNNNIVTVIY